MTKSTITRERLQEIAEDGFLKHGESKELARMALAAMDSEPVRNPVLSYADSYRDMAKQGAESVPIWSVITDLERNIAPLYRHAQQPVVPQDVLEALQKVARIRLDLNDFDGDRRGIADCLGDAEEALIEVVNRRAAMLQAQSDDDGEPTDDERIMAIEGIHNCERCGDEGWVVGEMGITRCACNQGNPVFKIDHNSDFIKHVKAVSEKVRAGNSPAHSGLRPEQSGAPPAQDGSSPAQNQGWIPVSERMPEGSEEVLCAKEFDGPGDWRKKVGYWLAGKWTVYGASWTPTHWMPLPAAPQELK